MEAEVNVIPSFTISSPPNKKIGKTMADSGERIIENNFMNVISNHPSVSNIVISEKDTL